MNVVFFSMFSDRYTLLNLTHWAFKATLRSLSSLKGEFQNHFYDSVTSNPENDSAATGKASPSVSRLAPAGKERCSVNWHQLHHPASGPRCHSSRYKSANHKSDFESLLFQAERNDTLWL